MRNANGTYNLPRPDVAMNTAISSDWANATMHDIAAELSNSLDNRGGSMGGQLRLIQGSTSEPSLTFISSPGVGLYSSGSDIMSVLVRGAQAQDWAPGLTQFYGVTNFAGDVRIDGTTLTVNDIVVQGSLMLPSSRVRSWASFPITNTGMTAHAPNLPGYYRDDIGVVHFRGSLQVVTSSVGFAFASMPVGFRPGGNSHEYMVPYTEYDGSMYFAKLTINSSGAVAVYALASSPSGGTVSPLTSGSVIHIDVVTYPAES